MTRLGVVLESNGTHRSRSNQCNAATCLPLNFTHIYNAKACHMTVMASDRQYIKLLRASTNLCYLPTDIPLPTGISIQFILQTCNRQATYRPQR